MKSIFIKSFPYINLILAMFKILIKEKKYERLQKKGQKLIEDIDNIFLSILYKVKTGVQLYLLPTKMFGNIL